MFCRIHRFALILLLVCLTSSSAMMEAFGQTEESISGESQLAAALSAVPDLPLEQRSPPSQTLQPGQSSQPDLAESNLAPLLGSPRAIVMPAIEPFMESPEASDSISQEPPQRRTAPSGRVSQPQFTVNAALNAPGEAYWSPNPDDTAALEYEQLDAETVRDLFNADSVRKLRKPMKDIRIVAKDNANVPENLAGQFMVKEPVLTIVAAGIGVPRPDRYPIKFRHRPLYFEQLNLERCGNRCGIAQNAISAGQFCMNTFFLPYHMCKTKPNCPVYCGSDCLTCESYSDECNALPLSYKGLATEAAAFAGFTFLLL